MKATLTFRVYTRYGTKCIRKYDNYADAECYANIHENSYRIEWTEPADPRRGIRERHNRVLINC